jgi:small subunit ribosomal protein S5
MNTEEIKTGNGGLEGISANEALSTSNADIERIVKEDNKKALYRNANRKPKAKQDEAAGGFQSKLIGIHRITKVVKGGRTLRFNAVVVMGNKNGTVAIGSAKAREVTVAIQKAENDAKKNFKNVPINGTTLPYQAIGKFGTSKVLLLPAKEGNGIIASGAVKAVLELAGYKDVTAKCYGSKNAMNVVKATLSAVAAMRTKEEIARLRDKEVDEI